MLKVSNNTTAQAIQTRLSTAIASHPDSEIIKSILNGKKYESGVFSYACDKPTQDNINLTTPASVRDLNNFTSHLYGGQYRCGNLAKLMGIQEDKAFLLCFLERASEPTLANETGPLQSLAGFSHRFLSETPQEFWHNLDQHTEEYSGIRADAFGLKLKTISSRISQLEFREQFFEEEIDKNSNQNPEKLPPCAEKELSDLKKVWDTEMEPTVMSIYSALINKGYSLKDLYT